MLAARENGTVTTLVAGSTVEVSYHLAYPHRVRGFLMQNSVLFADTVFEK